MKVSEMRRNIVAAAVFACAVALGVIAGCGGGSGSGSSSISSASTVTFSSSGVGGPLTGTVTAPSGVQLARQAAAGLAAKSYVSVYVFGIDDNGAAMTTRLAGAITNDSGVYDLTIPTGYSAASNMVVAAGPSTNLMRAFITATGTIDINPMTELVVSKVTASTAPLSSFSISELAAIQQQVNTAAASVDFSGKTTVAETVSALYTGTLKTTLDAAISSAAASN